MSTLRAYPRALPSGELEPNYNFVLLSLKPENHHWFDKADFKELIPRCEGRWIVFLG
jgi:hypothetical protein